MRLTADKLKNLIKSHPTILITDPAYHLASLYYAPEMAEIIQEVKEAFKLGITPERCEYGTTEIFFLKNACRETIAVFKTQRYWHEIAAFRLDHERFAGVPSTVLATIYHPTFGGWKIGACQKYIEDGITSAELGQFYTKNFSPSSIRRIAILDIRTLNSDRHTANLLTVQKTKLVPIDHGFIFPWDLNEISLDWLEWEQATTPFNDQELSYISLLDPEKDRRLLIDELYLDERLANRHFIATVLLKVAAIRGLTAKEIGQILIPKKPVKKSPFENLIDTINAQNLTHWPLFSRQVYNIIEKNFSSGFH
jgi:hypothetical protein